VSDLFVLPGPSAAPETPDPRHNLAFRMRPRTLEEFTGQEHLLAPGKLLHRLITSDKLTAALFHGPPGTGKTSLAHLIARHSRCRFAALNAVEATVADLRAAIEQADAAWRLQEQGTLLLIDEIHRFNKAQQDAILPHVERGAIQLIGATTLNPSFTVNPALLSRMQAFAFHPLTRDNLLALLHRALADTARGLGSRKVCAEPGALEHLAQLSDGDARRALNALEVGVLSTPPVRGEIPFTLSVAEECLQRRMVRYDRDGDAHYDTISAVIKCVRGSEPDAALYLLARMLEAGEDPRFLTRRLMILAAEDVGLADPQALPLAVACHQAVEWIGLPEARIPLAETTVYLAAAPKSNAAYAALEEALALVRSGRSVEIPARLRDTSYPGARERGHGEGYQYAHEYGEGVAPAWMFPIQSFYQPTSHGYEQRIRERLDRWARLRTPPPPAP
jgi:putative ATPase